MEPTRSNDEKFGAIKGLQYVIHEEWVEDDAMVIAGDNFFHGFELRKLRNLMWETKSFVLAVYDIKKSVYTPMQWDDKTRNFERLRKIKKILSFIF